MVSRSSRLVVALFAFLVAACSGDGSTGPDVIPVTEQTIDITNVFATASNRPEGQASSFAAVEIRKIRITVFQTPGTTILFQQTYDVDPSKSSWTLPFTAPVGATVRIVAELMSVTSGADKVEYSGQAGPLTITDCKTNCQPIPVQTYPGPVENLGATSVTITPATAEVTAGGTVQLTGAAAPVGPSYQLVWSSLDAAIATVDASGLVSGLEAGTARIVVIAGAKRDTAIVTVKPNPGVCAASAYTLGSSVTGTWASGDCVATTSGRRYDMHEFTIGAQTAFRAEVTGPAGRSVSLRRAGTQDYVQLMAGETFMPPSASSVQVRYILAPGSYVFEIATPDASTLGDYTLATSLDATASCNPLVFVTVGVTISESLQASDCAGIAGGKEDWFLILPNAGERINLTLSSAQIAPVLVFRDDRLGPASPTLASDIRFTPGETARVSYTTTFAGFHEIIVNNATSALGSYTLTIGSGSAANTCTPLNTTIGGRTLAVWEATDCVGPDGLYDAYPFTLAAQAAVRTTTSSTVAPKLTGVFAGSKEVLNYIRSSAGDLAINWYLAPGQYEFRVAAAAAAAGSSYTLTTGISDGNIGCATNATTGNVSFANQTLGAGDCTFEDRYEDRLAMYVEAGQEIVVEMNSSSPHSAIIRDPATPAGTVLRLVTAASGTATVTYRATVSGYYQAIFAAGQPNASLAYSGSVSVR